MVKTLRLGSDFTGLAVGAIACKQVSNKLGYKFVHTHSCDKSRASQKFVEYVCKAEVMQQNIMHRDLEACGPCDVFVWTAPCTKFSSAGTKEGVDVVEGRLAAFFVAVHQAVEAAHDFVRKCCDSFEICSL